MTLYVPKLVDALKGLRKKSKTTKADVDDEQVDG